MSSSKGFGKRFAFKRSHTNNEDRIDATPSPAYSHDVGKSSVIATQSDASASIDEVVRDISEPEANRHLSHFRRDHKWDPNMPDDTMEMTDAVTDAHDHKGEAQLVGEVIENSPYPEVSQHCALAACSR